MKNKKIANLICSVLSLFTFLLVPINQANCAFFSNLASPLYTKGGYVFYPGAIMTFAINEYEDASISYQAQHESQEETPQGIKNISHYGDLIGQGYLNGAYVLSQWAVGNFDNANLMISASFYSTVLTWSLKSTVRERRPKSNNRHSFPSGHTSLAFAFGTVLAIRHHWVIGLLGLGVASFIGYSRIVDNAHWLHDVVGGATIGASYALSLNSLGKEGQKLVVVPSPTTDSPGIKVVAIYSFD